MSTEVTTGTVKVRGATLHYEVRGSGPVLALIGNPMGSSGFSAIAEAMATDHTVITYDPRGTGQTVVADRTKITTPQVLAEDVRSVLTRVTGDPVTLFGSSGGAVTGLALITAHPDQVSLLIPHEPPLITLLPDAVQVSDDIDEIHQTYLRAGSAAAMRQFMLAIGVLGDEGARQFGASAHPDLAPAPKVPETDDEFFLANQLRATTSYQPDLTALAAAPTTVVVGVGASSQGQLAHRTGVALADLLGVVAAEFPGGHGGFGEAVPGFALQLRDVIAALG